MANNLCDNCENLFRVETSSGGMVFNQCTALKPPVDLHVIGEVRKCSSYTAKDLPWVIEKEAWLVKHDEEGKLYFKTPDGTKATVKKGIIGFQKMKKEEMFP